MTANHGEIKELEDLLRRALADDLPADVEAGMRERIRDFRAGTMGKDKHPASRAWLARRSAWAVLSVLMLVAGILLQGSQSRSELAARIAHLKAQFPVHMIGR